MERVCVVARESLSWVAADIEEGVCDPGERTGQPRTKDGVLDVIECQEASRMMSKGLDKSSGEVGGLLSLLTAAGLIVREESLKGRKGDLFKG